jgi:hypothetical protein
LLEKVEDYIHVHATAGLSSTVCKKAKISSKIIPAIKDKNGTIITVSSENANILNSYYASAFFFDRNIPETKVANSVKPSLLTGKLKKWWKKSVGPDGVPGENLLLRGEAMTPYLDRLLEV